MENKGLLILTSAILITLLFVVIVSAAASSTENSKNDSVKYMKQCNQDCRLNKNIAHQNCISVHKSESAQIREEYKKCTKNLKEADKNNTINKTEYKNKIKECNKKYLNALKEADKKRKECFKDVKINCEKKCKEEFCIGDHKPVCGIDNKTYSNECELKKANVTKAYDGKCNNLTSTKCTERPEICPTLHDPVCGWFNESVECIKYPCAKKYSNSCVACSDFKVDYWTPGKCPNSLKNSE